MDIWVVDDCVQGQNHAVCEDSACARMMHGDADEVVLFAVADGHGSPACVRSAKGSELAVKAALNWLERLAQNTADETDGWGRQLIDDVRERMATPLDAHFSDAAGTHASSVSYPVGAGHSACDSFAKSLVKDWRDAVTADANPELNPLTDAEIAAIHGAGYTWEKDHFFRLYGTTLVAGALLPDALLLLQQGDGCCCVMYEDGGAENPIAEDERCVGNVTSSMCDDDAAAHMRFAIVDRRESNPISCFVATDGVEKSVAMNGGVEDFFHGVVIDALEMPDDVAGKAQLHATLASLSEQGAHDDTSVAGFVELGRANAVAQILAKRRQRYRAELELRMLEQRQGSLMRGVERYRAAEAERERFRPWMEEYQRNERRIEELKTLSMEREVDDSPDEGDVIPAAENAQPVSHQTSPELVTPEVVAPEVTAPQQVCPEAQASGAEIFGAPAPQAWHEHDRPLERQFEPAQASVRRVPVFLLLGVLLLVVGGVGVALLVAKPWAQATEKVEVTPVPSATAEDTASAEAGMQSMVETDAESEVRGTLISVLEELVNSGDAPLLTSLGVEPGDVQTLASAGLAEQAGELARGCLGVLRTELEQDDGWEIEVAEDGRSASVTLPFSGALFSLSGQSWSEEQLLHIAQQALNRAQLAEGSGSLSRTISVSLALGNDGWVLEEGQLASIGEQTGLTQVCDRVVALLSGEDETSESSSQYGSGVSDEYDGQSEYGWTSTENNNH